MHQQNRREGRRELGMQLSVMDVYLTREAPGSAQWNKGDKKRGEGREGMERGGQGTVDNKERS
jgi:hypothetical protein